MDGRPWALETLQKRRKKVASHALEHNTADHHVIKTTIGDYQNIYLKKAGGGNNDWNERYFRAKEVEKNRPSKFLEYASQFRNIQIIHIFAQRNRSSKISCPRLISTFHGVNCSRKSNNDPFYTLNDSRDLAY